MLRNPVMFVVEVGSVLTTGLWIQALAGKGEAPAWFIGAVAIWLWFTVLFANFSEALAEGRGKAQAEALRRTRQETNAKKLHKACQRTAPSQSLQHLLPPPSSARATYTWSKPGISSRRDGEVVEGIASVDESAVTGESAPVIRESGGDRSAVTGGTRILSDWLVIKVTANPGEGFLDRMISLVEGAKRQKTPNEIALNILLAAFTIIFLGVCITLLPYSLYSVQVAGQGHPDHHHRAGGAAGLPDPHHHRRAALGHRHCRDGPPDPAQRDCPFRAGHRSRRGCGCAACWIRPAPSPWATARRWNSSRWQVQLPQELAEAAQLASLADETPEGRSIVVLAKEKYGLRGRTVSATAEAPARNAVLSPSPPRPA